MNRSPFRIPAAVVFTLACLPYTTRAQTLLTLPGSTAWVADNGDATYRNPIITRRLLRPDVIRLNDDYYPAGTEREMGYADFYWFKVQKGSSMREACL